MVRKDRIVRRLHLCHAGVQPCNLWGQDYVKVSQVKQTKQEQISTGYFENDLVGWEREWEDFRRADKGEGIGSAFGAAGRAGALAGIDAGASLFGIRQYYRRVVVVRGQGRLRVGRAVGGGRGGV